MVDQVIGQCIIEEKVGEGGMGIVYRARHSTLNKEVAIKLLRPNLPTDTNGVGRFVREGRAAASLDHPAIVNVYDAGNQNGVYYIVMQYVDGESLSARLDREHRIPIEEAVEIFQAAAEGIEHAHSKGIIHRDIKPDNILLGSDGSVKIADFGLARMLEYDGNLSQTGAVVGSPTFMSPEQALGKKTDTRADIYSLGATLYQMVTGEPPFRARGFMEAIWKIVKEAPPAAHQVQPEVSVAFSRYIHSLMRKDPRNRVQTIDEALENIRALENEEPLPRSSRKSRRFLVCSVAAVVILALGALCLVPWSRFVARAEEKQDASPATSSQPVEESGSGQPRGDSGDSEKASR